MDDRIWQEHIDQDKQQSKDICLIKLALFGDPSKPETVKAALVPTQIRLNTWMDGLGTVAKAVAGLGVFVGGLLTTLKAMGWL